jgi:hypothetical protein
VERIKEFVMLQQVVRIFNTVYDPFRCDGKIKHAENVCATVDHQSFVIDATGDPDWGVLGVPPPLQAKQHTDRSSLFTNVLHFLFL